MEAMAQLLPLPFSSYLPNDPRDAELLRLDTYWRAANYLFSGSDNLGERSAALRQEMTDARVEATLYTREHGEDPPEIAGWTWTPEGSHNDL
jgi:phosphoketolase